MQILDVTLRIVEYPKLSLSYQDARSSDWLTTYSTYIAYLFKDPSDSHLGRGGGGAAAQSRT